MTNEGLEERTKDDPVREAEKSIIGSFNEARGNRTFGEVLRAIDPSDPRLGHIGDALDNLLRKGIYGIQPTPQDPNPLRYNPGAAREKGYV